MDRRQKEKFVVAAALTTVLMVGLLKFTTNASDDDLTLFAILFLTILYRTGRLERRVG